jgi:formylglycine-generating enzyme required for sulfatase activity
VSRVFFIDTAAGEQRIGESDFPLSLGGSAQCAVALPGVPADAVLAWIALAEGHAYIQPATDAVELFHNHERVFTSSWLKSGDQVQLGDAILHWDVKGDQVFIRVRQRAAGPELTPPPTSPSAPAAAGEAKPVAMAPATTPAASRRRLRQLVIGVFSLLLLVAVFVLLATPVAINVTPAPEQQSLHGFPPPVPVGQRLLVVPGSYTLRATREGYRPLEQTIEITGDGFQTFDFELQELPGRVHITLDPVVPFKVMVDVVAVVVDEHNIADIERGRQRLRIETARYLPETRELDITGRGVLQELAITLQPAWASVQLSSQPPGAEVVVDEVVLGTTPLETELVQGPRTIHLSLAGYKPASVQQLIEAGTTLALDVIELQPADGRLVLDTRPTGATVSIDGSFHGSTPLTVELASGTDHRVRLSRPGYRTTEQQVTLEAAAEQPLTVELKPEYGIVFVTSRPADARLKLDGKPKGAGTQRLRLTTRAHTLEFSKSGYVTQKVTVTPRAGTSRNVDVTLKTLAQAKADATPSRLRTAAGQQLRLVQPAGRFRMGASRREAGRRANESQRLVEFTRPFYFGLREVTNAEYRRFKSAHDSGSAEGVALNGDNYPVVNISWEDAARYCNWLGRKDKLPPAYREQGGKMQLQVPPNTGYRLPTEAEWAYVARVAGRTAPARYPWAGSYPPVLVAGNFADARIADTLAHVVPGYDDGYRGPAPVGSFAVHPLGFHDLGGNVAEWTNDYYAVYPGMAEKPVKDPAGPASGDHHVVRDASWRHGTVTELRLSYRDYSRGPRPDLGFRIARYAN